MTKNDMSDTRISTEMLPCPFCGAKPYAHVQNSTSHVAGDPSRYLQMVWCDDCGTQGPHRETEAQAIAAWNTRHPQPVNEPGEWQVEDLIRVIEDATEAKNRPIYGDHKGDWSPLSYRELATAILRSASIPKVELGVKGSPVTLAECPIGLFYAGGELCLKTEYGDNNGRIDAYIVSSGEFFWGGTSTPQEQRKVLVQPFELSPSTSEGEAYTAEDGLRRVRQIAIQSEVAPMSMGEIIKVADMALGDETPLPDWMNDPSLYAAPQPTPVAPVPVTIDAAMIERFQNAYRQAGEKRHWQPSWPDADASFEILTAALSAKPTGEE